MSKPTVWRWQQAYMNGVVERLLKDRGKGAHAGKKAHSAEVRLAIVTRTAKKKPKQATHWSAPMPTFSANFGSMESLKGDLELEAMLLPDARRGRVTDADLLRPTGRLWSASYPISPSICDVQVRSARSSA